jgi:hypothetical protein
VDAVSGRGAIAAGLAGAALLGAAGCTQPTPDTSGFAEAARLGREVVDANPMADVVALAEGHRTDVRLSCEGYPTEPKYPACELSRDAAVAHVASRLTAMGYAPETLELPDTSGAGVARNVVAERPGLRRPDEVVLVMAHHDAFHQGADDNSSGVAVLLEAARVAAGHGFERTIRFVSIDLEERGAVGSTRYVEAGLAADVVAALVLETVGYACHTPGCQDAPPGLDFGDVGDRLFVAGNGDSADLVQRAVALAHGEGLGLARGVVVPGDGAYLLTSAFLRSDNGLLWLRGTPTVMLTDTADFRNPNYHEPTDTPETLDPAFLASVARMTVATMALLAEVRP